LQQVFHYYTSALDLVQLVNLADLPGFLVSRSECELYPWNRKSVKAKLLLDQLKSLRGKVGAIFSLSCTVTNVAQPAASQLSSQRWRESIARRPKSLPVPDVEVKGESAVYFLLVQGWEDAGRATCRVRFLNSDSQLNGAAAMATLSGLLRRTSSSGGAVGNILCPLPCLQGDVLLKRERKVNQLQALVLKEYLRQKEETSGSNSVPASELKEVLNLARMQYLKMMDSSLPSAASCFDINDVTASSNSGSHNISQLQCEWPERSVLHNVENLQKRRQKRKFGLLGPGSSDNLLCPKDGQKGSPALLDAREFLKHFTSDGLPAGELQPLTFNRGDNAFQLSPDLSPGRVSLMPFSKASASHFHGLEFCLDNQRCMDRDQAFVKLQSRLIRYETQTTCSKEPCALPFALSRAPSPAVMSEPGSVPDGETLENADVARLKRRSWDMEMVSGYPRKSVHFLHSIFVQVEPLLFLQGNANLNQKRPFMDKLRKKQPKSHAPKNITDCYDLMAMQAGLSYRPEYRNEQLDLKTSRGLNEEMKKAASCNVKQVKSSATAFTLHHDHTEGRLLL
ncbi:unnamed protein product, partial [Tetraodon nigroviridis]